MRVLNALALPLLLVAACGSSDTDPGDDDDRGDVDGGPVDPDAGPGEPDAAPAGSRARLVGVLRRTAAPDGDAVGDIYVALFDRDPVLDMAGAQVVGRARLADADLSVDGASVAYALEDIPPRPDDYFLIAFLDDNDNVDAANPDDAGPDRGDLVSLDGLAAPAVAVTTTGDVAHDIELNSVLPF